MSICERVKCQAGAAGATTANLSLLQRHRKLALSEVGRCGLFRRSLHAVTAHCAMRSVCCSANLQLLLQIADARGQKHLSFMCRLQLGHCSPILTLKAF
jgi:hypothetical protein